MAQDQPVGAPATPEAHTTPHHATRPLLKPSAVSAWRLVDNPPPLIPGRVLEQGLWGQAVPSHTNRSGCHSSAFLNDNSEQLSVGPGGAYKYPPIIRQARTAGPLLLVTRSLMCPLPPWLRPCGTRTVGRWMGGHCPGYK